MLTKATICINMLSAITILLAITGSCYLEKTGCLRNHLIKEIENNLAELKTIQVKEDKNSGETYIRWGKTKCPDEAHLIYEGFAAGGHYSIGGSGSNYLCLPKDPEWKNYDDKVVSHTGKLFGVEYEIFNDKPFSKSFLNKDMPCAVCLSTRSTTLMIPGKLTCPQNWYKEFSGYLMSEGHFKGHMSTEYICVDEKLEAVPGGDASRDEALIYPVEGLCGSLKCPPYVNGRELTCVVCSK